SLPTFPPSLHDALPIFPTAFGFRLNERWGIIAALLWILGFMLAFLPLYALGLMGLPRRSVSYGIAAYVPLEIVAFIGAMVVAAADRKSTRLNSSHVSIS